MKRLQQEGPSEPFEQYKITQLRHFLRINRCAVSGNKGCLVKRLRLTLQELEQNGGHPIRSQLQRYKRQELKDYLKSKGAPTTGKTGHGQTIERNSETRTEGTATSTTSFWNTTQKREG